MSNNITTFWRFLRENTIEIPIIQRDYAQGRAEKVNIRNSFLLNLKQALDGTLPNEEKTLKLDFIYGSVEHEKLNPLDGQQRLTTLWLLHWYIALRANQLGNVAETLRNFTYETRVTSREFCQQLCKADNFKDYTTGAIVDYITSRTWFYSAWKQDPTIQSMLTMLSGTKKSDKKREDIIDGLEELFIDTTDFATYWEKLTSNDAPIIFYYLPMQDFGLSDDLYLKMNARGKQLTSFENFKADLIGYIEQQARDNKDWEILLDPQSGLPIKLDTVWMDIFWNNKSVDSRVDEIYFSFLNRFFWNELFIAKNGGQYLLDIGKGEEGGNKENENASYRYLNGAKPSYPGFDAYKYFNKNIPIEFFYNLRIVLDRYIAVPKCNWDSNFHFIPQYTEDGKVTNLTQPHRVVFFAICKYFKEGESEEISLKRWLRVVWNLVSGEDENGRAEIRSTSAMRAAIEFIGKIESHNVYESLSKVEVTGNSVFDERCKEEIAKARQILDKNGDLRKYEGRCEPIQGGNFNTWEDAINEAESYAFFKGAIRFLFRDEDGDWNWDDFDMKWENAKKYFDGKGVKETFQQDAKLLRYYFSSCTKWGHLWGFDYDFTPASWRNILLTHSAPVCKMLMDEDPDFQTANYISKITNFENGYENIQKHVHEVLMNTDILVEASKFGMRLNWKYDTYCLYPSNAKADWKKYVIGNYRNEILSDLCDKDAAKDIGNCRFGSQKQFFWGWNVDFEFSGKKNRWHRNNYVYLMDENWDYVIKDYKASTDEDKYFCFNAKNITDSDTFIQKLSELIAEYENEIK